MDLEGIMSSEIVKGPEVLKGGMKKNRFSEMEGGYK